MQGWVNANRRDGKSIRDVDTLVSAIRRSMIPARTGGVIRGTNVIAKPEHQLLIKLKELVLEEGAVLGHRAATESNWYRIDIGGGTAGDRRESRVDVSRMGYLPGRTGQH